MKDNRYYKCEKCGKAFENRKREYGDILCNECQNIEDDIFWLDQYDNCYCEETR